MNAIRGSFGELVELFVAKPPSAKREFAAFISYSHADFRPGKQQQSWGDWLHQSLENYRLPWSLVGTTGSNGAVPRRLTPVFIDREELGGSADLPGNIYDALKSSRHLIVICSPHAAISKWVNREVAYFKSLGREDRVLAFIIDGHPNAADRAKDGLLECFPEAVRFKVGADGKPTGERTQPTAPDARLRGDGPSNALLKLIAGLTGVPFALLKRREERRQRIRRLQLAGAAALALGVLASWWFAPTRVTVGLRPPAPPPGLVVRLDGKPQPFQPGAVLRVSAGEHDLDFTAPDFRPSRLHLSLPRGGGERHDVVDLYHEQGKLIADCLPNGSSIEITPRNSSATQRFGAPIPALPLDTGDYRLLAWTDGHYESERFLSMRNEQDTSAQFWLEAGVDWNYASPAIQGGLIFLTKPLPDGAPVLAHNERGRVVYLSGRGAVVGSVPVWEGNMRSFVRLDLGDRSIIASAMEVEKGGPQPGPVVLALSASEPAKTLWEWHGPETNFEQPHSVSIDAVPRAGGTGEIAVQGSDGKIYLLDAEGRQRLAILVTTKRIAASVGLFGWSAPSRRGVVSFVREGNPDRFDAGEDVVVAGFDAEDGRELWRENLGRDSKWFALPVGESEPSWLFIWDAHRWRRIDPATGRTLLGDTLAAKLIQPVLVDLPRQQGRGILFIHEAGHPSYAIRLADGRRAWTSAGDLSTVQVDRQFHAMQLASGAVLTLDKNGGLAAVDPVDGKVAWRASGNVRGLLPASGEGSTEIFATVAGRGLVCLNEAGRELWALRFDKDVEPWFVMPPDALGTPREVLFHRHAAVIGLAHAPRMRWGANAIGPMQSTPVVVRDAQGKPLVIQLAPWADDIFLRGLAGGDGAARWKDDAWISADHPPAVGRLEGPGDVLVAVGHPSAAELARDRRVVDGWYVYVLRPDTGERVRAMLLKNRGFVSCTPALADFRGTGVNDIALSLWNENAIVLVDHMTGEEIWRAPTAGPNMGFVAAADLDGDGAPEVIAPSGDGNLYALKGRTGETLWREPLESGGSQGLPVIAELDGQRCVLQVTMGGRLIVCDGRTGKRLWAFPDETVSPPRHRNAMTDGTGQANGHAVVVRRGDDALILTPLGEGGVAAFDWKTRRERWRSPAGFPVIAAPALAHWAGGEQAVIAATTGDLFVVNLADGHPLWHITLGDHRNGNARIVEAEPVVTDLQGRGVEDIVVAGADFHLYVIDGAGPMQAVERGVPPR